MNAIMAKAVGYLQPTIDPSLRLYVPFNEGVGNIAKDYSQYGSHVQLTDVDWGIGKSGGTGKFNGNSSFGDCGNDPSLDITDAITIEAWVKLTATGVYQEIMIKAGIYGLEINHNILNFYDFGLTPFAPTTSFVGYFNKWTHIVSGYDGSNIFIYINGDNKLTTPVTGSPTGGASIHNHMGYHPSLGRWVKIYNRVLSAAQNAADYYELPQFSGPFYDEGAILLEIGDNLLLETGDNLLLN